MKTEDFWFGRFLAVIFWVLFVAIMEEVLKIGCVALGLKRRSDDAESSYPVAQFIAESPRAVAICGVAAGIGFACIENVPRLYAISLEQPLVGIQQSQWGQASQEMLVDEGMLRAGRVWTTVFWCVFNIQPWLCGLAAVQLAKISDKGPLSPKDWLVVLRFVCCIHFFFDLLDRSSSFIVEVIGCCAIPYAMYAFRKEWNSMATEDGLLGQQGSE